MDASIMVQSRAFAQTDLTIGSHFGSSPGRTGLDLMPLTVA